MNSIVHRQRLITGCVLTVLLGAAVGLGGWYLFAAVMAASLLALGEFYQMAWPVSRLGVKFLGLLLGALLIFASQASTLAGPALVLLGAFWAMSLLLLGRFNTEAGRSWPDLLALPVGLIYIPLTLQFFFSFSIQETALVILAAMGSDIAAFYAGSAVGGRKLWPEVSPKKTWSGLFGGLTASVVLCLLMGLVFGKTGAWSFVWLGLGLGTAAILGDLFESALKRRFATKDSGCLLPGHGGMLDRIDGLLLVVAVYVLVRTFHPFF